MTLYYLFLPEDDGTRVLSNVGSDTISQALGTDSFLPHHFPLTIQNLPILGQCVV